LRQGLAVLAAVGWLTTVPFAAAALIGEAYEWGPVAFLPIALLTALAWWLHLREHAPRSGAIGETAGWFLVGSIALLGVAGFFWMLVAAAVLVSAIAYGLVLVVTHHSAGRPAVELATGLSLIVAGAVPALFVLISGIGFTDAWWMTAHALFALGMPVATVLGAFAQS
jgi:hypothetical protein